MAAEDEDRWKIHKYCKPYECCVWPCYQETAWQCLEEHEEAEGGQEPEACEVEPDKCRSCSKSLKAQCPQYNRIVEGDYYEQELMR